jgi:hypothetical protein
MFFNDFSHLWATCRELGQAVTPGAELKVLVICSGIQYSAAIAVSL